MSTQNSQPKRIDVLELSDSEKTQFMNAAREVLRQSVEDAKFWRASSQAIK